MKLKAKLFFNSIHFKVSKKLILIFIIIISTKSANANDYKPFFAQFVSNETTSINGTLYVHAFIKCTDTLNFIQDVSYQLPNGWSQVSYQSYSSSSSNTLYMPGDSIPIVFTVSYPTSSLPYYPVDLKIFAKIKSKYNDTLEARFHGKVFFTPWNSIETWAEEDFYSSGRVWKEEVLHGSHSRVTIDKDSIPLSDIGSNDTITEDWHYEARLATYPGLPFYVKMKPIHPDTLKYYADNFGDSVSSLSNRLNKSSNHRYIGNITGNLLTTLINDNNETNPLLLKGVLIKLIDRDGPSGTINDVLDETHTDENGNFTLSYNVWQPFENGELELELHIKAKNKNYKYEVLSKGGAKVLFGITEELAPFDLGSIGHDFNRNNLQLITNDNAFKVCNWVYNTFHYCESQGILSKVIPNDKKLHIATNFDLKVSMMIPNTINIVDMFTGGDDFYNPTIFLSEDDDEHENTLYHEWGHYMMWRMQNRNFITRLDDGKCLGNFGSHNWGSEQHMRMVWTEGFANAIQFIMDGANWHEDNEYALDEGTNLETRVERSRINNGLRSEYYLACAIYDLWDGADKGLPSGTNVTIPGTITNSHPYNDRAVTGGTIGNDWILEEDNISLSFNGLMRPIYENDGLGNGLKNIYEYVMYLMNNTYSNDCEAKSDIARCFRENRVMDNISFYNNTVSTAGGHRLDRNTGFSSDELYEVKLIEDRGVNIACIPITDQISYRQEIIEEVPNHVCHILNPNHTLSDIPSSISLTDNIRLGYNFTKVSQISECLFNTNSNFNLSANLCNGVEYSINNTLFQIGNSNGQTISNFFINDGATFNLDQMAILKINNNSKFVVEQGATLNIYAGSRIILNGDNAILEIRGTLNIHDGATFTFEGGSAGSGHVVFNTTGKKNIILGTASKIKFLGANTSDRVMEVMADYMFWPDNAQLNSSGSPINANASFEMQNGLVALGHNARLNIGTAMTLNNVRFYAEPTSKAKGIVLWGNKHTINNVTLENVYGGIQSFNTVGGNKLTMAHVTVSGANVALLSDGKGSYLNDFESDGNFWGIHVNGSEWPNNFYLPKVIGAQWGTMYTGGFSSSNLVMNKPDYEENEQAVSFTGSGNLVLDCGRFYNVNPGGGTRGNGITQYGGRLILNDALGYMAGRVTFKDNINTLFLNQSEFYLNNGYNDLSYEYNSNNNQLALRGSSSHKTGSASTIKADNNLWHGTNAPSTQGWPLPSPPLAYQNYNITCQAQLLPGFYMTSPVNIPSTPFLTLSQFTTAKTARCINGSTTTDKGTKTTSNMITTTHFSNTNLQDAVGTILDNMHNTAVPDYGEVIDYWAEILTEVSYVTPYSEEDYYYIDLAESKMMEALGLLLSNDTTLELSESGQSHFETILNVQDTWIELLDEDTTDAGKDLKNSFHFDKGAVYHLEGENSLAQSQWLTMQLWANQQYLDHTDFWLCRLVRENALKNCGNNPDSIANIPECQYSEGENQFVMKDPTLSEGSVIKEDNKISKSLSIYPNPASTLVTVELETNKNETATITIYSIDGKSVKTLPNIKLQIGKNKLFIPVFDIARGIYSIGIETKNSIWNEKVKVE